MADSPYAQTMFGMTDDELLKFPTVYRDDLLKGQVVLVSGGGTGIGKAIAVLLGRLGANIVVCSRKEEKLQSTREVLEKIGVQCDTHAMTIRDPEEVDGLMGKIWDKHGRLDMVVNNAGGQFPQEAIDYEYKGWNAVIDTNLTGTFLMMQAAARQWKAHEQSGSIVNIIADFWRGMPQIAHTSAARAAVANLAMSLSVEWAPINVRVNCVAPGVIETSGLNVYPEEARRTFNERNPMKRLGTVMEVAEAVVYLGGPSGSYITGETLTVDGGQYMWGHAWPFGKPDYYS
jgi:citronellol/citronellal dehydrogenase